ncbi:class I adenylate-forming enzyme family protein [Stappia sp. P2PMeth1]|uniref:AMP-binding protein n=1 Tax=Stappia sp. P2PMeth1 TaxID=2003586 RepID=UPI0016449323|nr:class I adenylate-forming enzyme family protein [Stappia sp. P2PMeth1]
MILTPLKTIEAHRQSGIWGRVTLDALFRKTATAHPERLALCDADEDAGGFREVPRRLTYGEADAEISRLAAFFAAVGLKHDNVIGLQSAGTVDAVITFLAALRAGLVIAPLPLHWRQKNVLEALTRAGAKALVAGESFGGRSIGLEARDTAADLFALRFVFGLGRDVADGLMEVEQILGELPEDLEPAPTRRDQNAADHVATLTWTRSTSGEPLPIARSHNQWIACGLMPYLELSLPQAPNFLLPYALTGMAGIGAGLIPWLLSGGTLHLHHPGSLRRLAAHADAADADIVLCPGALVPALDRRIERPDCRIVPVWQAHSPAPAPHGSNRELVDLHIADEFAMVARTREGSALPRPLPSGRIGSPSAAAQAPALLEIAIDTETSPAMLKVRGAMVPDSAWPACKVRMPTDKAGFVDTLLPLRQTENGITGFGIPGQMAPGVGSLPTLDALYAAFPGIREAAAFLVEDGILGARLYAAMVPQKGLLFDVEGFYAYLEAEHASLAEVPHRVLPVAALPRNAAGKVDREALAARAGFGHSQVA